MESEAALYSYAQDFSSHLKGEIGVQLAISELEDLGWVKAGTEIAFNIGSKTVRADAFYS